MSHAISISTMQFQICKIGISALNPRGIGMRNNISNFPHFVFSSTTYLVEEYST